MSDLTDRLEAEGSDLSLEAAKVLKAQYHRATNAEYMKQAYLELLGPKGLEVALMWAKKGVNRVHHDWQPSAYEELDGEGRAQFILDAEVAPKKLMNF